MKHAFLKIFYLSLFFAFPLYSQEQESTDSSIIEEVDSRPQLTIADKISSLSSSGGYSGELNKDQAEALESVNRSLKLKSAYLEELYDQAFALSKSEREDPMIFHALRNEITKTKNEILEIQNQWKEKIQDLGRVEDYALWHQPESTLLQLVIDYGDPKHLYIVPPEIGCIPCSLSSNLPIPAEAWSECLDLVLAHYGVQVNELHPFVKELSFMSTDLNRVASITDKAEDLDLVSAHTRLCFVLSPSSTDPRSTYNLLQKFANIATTDIDIIGGKLFIVGTKEEIQELLKIYSFSEMGGGGQESQIIQLSKIPPLEMEKMLLSSFHGGSDSGGHGSSLRILPLEQIGSALFITGTKDEVKRAKTFISDLEAQVEDPKEKTIFWYTAKHSDPEELATVLANVYDILTGQVPTAKKESDAPEKQAESVDGALPLAVASKTINPMGGNKSHKTADGRNNFIVDAKTGALIMVVEQEALPKIKELLKKLDVPKKMVQLEVLLFERKLSKQSNTGLNLLRLGSQALGKNGLGMAWSPAETGRGILEFFTSHEKGSGIPAYDAAYQFLLGQEDVQINASPSITTMNQTPARIAVVEEISVDAGATDKKQHNYSRAQYGIIIEITPTINLDDEEGETGFVTLDTDITFDTTQKNSNDRPDVTRRHIKNHVRIADGETVILGGLRRKNSSNKQDAIPFLGEIPGIGKLFSMNEGSDSNTEMFMFITPKIINDPIKDAAAARQQQLKKRPGDVPLFFHELLEAKEREKKQLFEGSLYVLFGPQQPSTSPYCFEGEYEGRE